MQVAQNFTSIVGTSRLDADDFPNILASGDVVDDTPYQDDNENYPCAPSTDSCPNDAGTDPAVTGSPVVSDNCTASVTVGYSDNTIDGSDCSGLIERTWTARDDCGNESSRTQLISIEDITPPSIVLPDPASPVPCGGDRSPA